MKSLTVIAVVLALAASLYCIYGRLPTGCRIEVTRFTVKDNVFEYVMNIKFNADSQLEWWETVNGTDVFKSQGGSTSSHDPIFSKTIANMTMGHRMISGINEISPGARIIRTPKSGDVVWVDVGHPFCYLKYVDKNGDNVERSIKVSASR